MTLVVPFDGSELAEAALVRATEFGTVFEEDVLAISVIRNENAKYARERDWIGPNEEFDLETVVTSLHEQVMDCVRVRISDIQSWIGTRRPDRWRKHP